MPSPITLADLVSPATQADVLALELQIATTLGLQTSTWQPLDPSRTILQINATLVSQYSAYANFLAQGGFASYAAEMVDSSGAPVTSWMDLISNDNYNLPRIQATAAAGPVPYNNTGANTYSYSPNSPLKFQNPIAPNATYTSTGSGSIAPGTGTVNIQADAAYVGAAGIAGVGTTLILLTPKSGVSIQPQTVALVGAPQETNAALLVRCQAKLSTLSALSQLAALIGTTTPVPAAPGGASGAYYFVATTIPQGSVASAVWPYAVTSPITRVGVTAVGGGLVDVYVANAAGSPPAGDVTAVNAAIQALVVPQGARALVVAAANTTIPVSYTVYVRSAANITPSTVQANIASALTSYFTQLPIGGVLINGNGVVPIDAIIGTIFGANAGTVDVTLSAPVADVLVPSSAVPVIGAVTGQVVLV